MVQPMVSIELPADYWAGMVVNKKVLDVVAVLIERRLRQEGLGQLVDQARADRLADLKAQIEATAPGMVDKAEKAIRETIGALRRPEGPKV